MALPAEIAHLVLGASRPEAEPARARALPLGFSGVDAVLPDGGLLRGGVVELAVAGGAALATTLVLAAVRSAAREAELRGGETPWSAFVDPTGTLHGPGVEEAGVRLDRLLVVRPPLEALARTALRLVESQAFVLVAVDLVGVPGAWLDVGLGSFPRIVRRMAIAAEESSGTIVLITDRDARRPLPLPVAQRIELARPAAQQLSVRIAKDRRGRVSSPRKVELSTTRATG
jgi:hypothetical protein